ncbi:MAG TPA: undecaprenyl-phosphate glucose phosphotransferase [Hyphomicrobium sp.]|nr:undecaprenyl-phosphate glucose phosphotransferase [Hyphomicrobium sp.]
MLHVERASPTQTAHVIEALRLPHKMPRLADFRFHDKSTLVSMVVIRGAVRAFDFAVVVALGLTIALLYVDEPIVVGNAAFLMAVIGTGLATVAAFELLQLYSLPALTSFVRQMPRALLGWTATFALLIAGLFFLKAGHEFSRVWFALWYATGAIALMAERVAVGTVMHHWTRQGRLFRRAAIYGGGTITEGLIGELEVDLDSDVRIMGVFDDRGDDRVDRIIAGYPRLGGLSELVEFARKTRLDVVIIALPITAERRLSQVARALSVLPAEVKIPARSTELRFTRDTYSRVGNVAMIDLLEKPIADWGGVTKWVFDKVVGTIALLLLAPVMLAVAVAIKLDSRGPVLFRQKRHGFNNELIEIFKFRSMYVDRCDENAAKLVSKDDPRVTRVGRFIRRTSLDELPQLLNVISGSLSLVGPRPHALQAKAAGRLYAAVVDGYFGRHKVKPGITGWAQIHGWRGETDTPEKIQKRVEHDIYYIENWSLLLDAYILFKTPFALLKSDNAY